MNCVECGNFSNQDRCPADCDPELLNNTGNQKGGFESQWCPEVCPVTFMPFFMWLEHPELGWVPTYGGPLDSYTIPTPCLPESDSVKRSEIKYTTFRFDHDAGCWLDEEEDPGVRLIADDYLLQLTKKVRNYAEIIRTSNQIIHDKVVIQQCALIEFSKGDNLAAERWIYNDLSGPGFIPNTDDPYHDNADLWWGANNSDPLRKCACGNPSYIIMDNVTACSEECWTLNSMMRDLHDMNC